MAMAALPAVQTRLIGLARDRSEETRAALLRELTDVFLDDPQSYSARELHLFGEVMSEIAAGLDGDTRKEVAGRLAAARCLPAQIARDLTQDSIAVARDLLRQSGALDDATLLAAATAGTERHRLAIAERPQLTAALSDVLIAHNERRVLAAITKNGGAALSRAGAERLIAAAEATASLRAPLLARTDLPLDLRNRLFFVASEKLRKAILKANAAPDDDAFDALLEEARRHARQARRSTAARRLDGVADALLTPQNLTEELLCTLMKDGEHDAFDVALARLAQVTPETARRIAADPSGQALALACKAIGFSKTAVAALIADTDYPARRQKGRVQKTLKGYDTLDETVARRMLATWDVLAAPPATEPVTRPEKAARATA